MHHNLELRKLNVIGKVQNNSVNFQGLRIDKSVETTAAITKYKLDAVLEHMGEDLQGDILFKASMGPLNRGGKFADTFEATLLKDGEETAYSYVESGKLTPMRVVGILDELFGNFKKGMGIK